MYLVFTRTPCESYRRRLRSLLLYLCHVFRALINSLICVFSSVLYARMQPSQPIGEGSAAVSLEGTFQFWIYRFAEVLHAWQLPCSQSVFQKRDHACLSEEGTSLSFRRSNKQPEVEWREFWTVGKVGQHLACCSWRHWSTVSYRVLVADEGLWVLVLGHWLSISWTTLGRTITVKQVPMIVFFSTKTSTATRP